MLGRRRETWWIWGCGPEAVVDGEKTPDSRKGLMLAIVRREEAEGESKMMGSIRERDFGGLGVREAGIVVGGPR